jgi:hypothetical protein
MIRPLAAAAGLAIVLAGLSSVATPAYAGEHDGEACIGTRDQRTPGSGPAICLSDWLPGDNITNGEIVRTPGTPSVSLPRL